MSIWKIAGVQMDCHLGDIRQNRDAICRFLQETATQGAKLSIFPECALTGYSFPSKEAALDVAETIHGPSLNQIQQVCEQLQVWAVVGFLEKDETSGDVFNSAALIGPGQDTVNYRKVHLPCLGVDRFVTPGDKPFAVHEIGDLRIGMTICYDGSFPEASRILTLQGADLIVLPTNWPTNAERAATYLVSARALENHVYYAAINRVGEESGFQFIGKSRIVDYHGDTLAIAEQATPTIIYAEIEPEKARKKQIVNIPGEYEVNRVRDRRPEMYDWLTKPS